MPAPSAQPAPAAPENFSPVPSTESANNDKLQQALQAKMNQTPAVPAPAVQPKPVPATMAKKETPGAMAPAPAVAPAPAMAKTPAEPTLSLPPLMGPSSPLPPAKQQKLDELLNLYRADRITPEQYHDQRAKILAEP
jgi:hypothetical protein